jgi:hypothetical protein
MGKPAPNFWWDFKQPGEGPIIVQSDYIGGYCLAEFHYEGFADMAIEQAEQLIDDFKSGRKTPSWNKNEK